jgi:hypothetical protein
MGMWPTQGKNGPYLKNNLSKKQRRALRYVVQVVQYPPSKCKAKFKPLYHKKP